MGIALRPFRFTTAPPKRPSANTSSYAEVSFLSGLVAQGKRSTGLWADFAVLFFAKVESSFNSLMRASSRWAMRGRFHAAEHLVEFGAVEVSAIQNDACDFLRVGNVFEGIGGKQNKVGELSFFDCA
jgi:hypothetical protein